MEKLKEQEWWPNTLPQTLWCSWSVSRLKAIFITSSLESGDRSPTANVCVPRREWGLLSGWCISTVKTPRLQHGGGGVSHQPTCLSPVHRPKEKPLFTHTGLCAATEVISIPGKTSQLTTLTNVFFHSWIWTGCQESVDIWANQVAWKRKLKMNKYNF